jgi:hypothetical protein
VIDLTDRPAAVAQDDLGLMANNQQLAEWLYKAIRSGATAYEKVPPLVEQIVAGGKWMHRYAMHHRREIHMSPDEFLRFVKAKPPDGLDATPEQVRMFLKDPKILDLWDKLTVKGRGSNGVSNNREGKNQHTPKPDPVSSAEVNRDVITVNLVSASDPEPEIQSTPKSPERGTSRQYAIRKLRNDAPELHARVLAGEISANRAMVEAGFRRRSFTIPDDPDDAGRLIAKHFRGERLEAVLRAMGEAARSGPAPAPDTTPDANPEPATVMGRTRAEYEALALRRNGAEWMEANRAALDRERRYMVETFGD